MASVLGRFFLGARLRPGNVHTADGGLDFVLPILRWLKGFIPRVWLRADAGFPAPSFLDALEAEEIPYVFRLRSNRTLDELAEPLLRRPPGRPPAEGRTWLHELPYRATSWSRTRRVVLVVVERRDAQQHRFRNHLFVPINVKRAPRPCFIDTASAAPPRPTWATATRPSPPASRPPHARNNITGGSPSTGRPELPPVRNTLRSWEASMERGIEHLAMLERGLLGRATSTFRERQQDRPAPDPLPFMPPLAMPFPAGVDAEGTIWVLRNTAEEGVSELDMFGPDFQFLGEYRLTGHELTSIRVSGEFLAARTQDEDGVAVVRLFRIRREAR